MAKTGVVDVGGGFRGIYAAGVLDRCIDDGVTFNLGIGVSAGSANIASFISRQKGRNFRFYTEYGLRPQYAGIRNFLFKRSFLDLDYVYGTLSNTGGEDPVDFEAFAANPMDFIVVAAEAETGEVAYFDKQDIKLDDLSILKASSAIPTVCKPYEVEGIARAKALEAEGRVLIVAPDDTCGVSTLTRDKEKLYALYAKGYADGAAVARFVS